MYERFFGLRERPFELTANPKYLLLTPKHREALSNLQYGLSARRGITLLLGEAGTGKTSLIASVLQTTRLAGSCIVELDNPTLTHPEFYELLAQGFGLSRDAQTSKSRFLFELREQILRRQRRGDLTALIIDEAQSLPDVLLEEIRLLANMETPTEKLLPVILSGQPELGVRLNEPGLSQLKQRVALRCALSPLDLRETAAYISSRITAAGGDSAKTFTREAVIAVHEWSRGIPRTINVLCDNALVSGFALEQRPVGMSLVLDVCRDFDLRKAVSGNGHGIAQSATVRSSDEDDTPSPPTPDPVEAGREKGIFSQVGGRRRFSFF